MGISKIESGISHPRPLTATKKERTHFNRFLCKQRFQKFCHIGAKHERKEAFDAKTSLFQAKRRPITG